MPLLARFEPLCTERSASDEPDGRNLIAVPVRLPSLPFMRLSWSMSWPAADDAVDECERCLDVSDEDEGSEARGCPSRSIGILAVFQLAGEQMSATRLLPIHRQ